MPDRKPEGGTIYCPPKIFLKKVLTLYLKRLISARSHCWFVMSWQCVSIKIAGHFRALDLGSAGEKGCAVVAFM